LPVKAAKKKVENLKRAATSSNAKPTVAVAEKMIMAAEEEDKEDDSYAAAYEAETGSDEDADTWAGPPPEYAKRVVKQRAFYGK